MSFLSYRVSKTIPDLIGILSFREHPQVAQVNKNGQDIVSSVVEDCFQYRICLMIPGFSNEDFAISLNDEVITIEAGRNITFSQKGIFKKAGKAGHFCRSFNLPDHDLGNEPKVSYQDGLFMLSVPKAQKNNKQKSNQ
jgi:HSP20 family molecular chaperone IbpA